MADLATLQHGVVALGQLMLLGASRRHVNVLVANGHLHRVHRGVFSVGHRNLSIKGRWMAAVLAAGPGAFLSHLSAAKLRNLTEWSTATIHVIAPRRCRIPGVSVHRCSIAPDEVEICDGIPTTGLARTLFDCAGILGAHRLEKLLQEAEFRRLSDTLSLDDLVRRYPGHRGVSRARSVLERGRFGASITKEEMELRFAKFLDDHGLPAPVLNGIVSAGESSFEVDCHWPDSMLIVELDSRSAHLTGYAFENDRARDRALGVAGWTVIRITWRQLHDQPEGLAADLRTLLGV